ncbi:MAG: hypothetical protein GF317_03595 [Candidatus Lokiarchaeota archaeon]|nr:hypothetical protein [Candidatus Lokiarchaeota archaeon]MBD3198971.1 hypothetical protein [Candidatus Lokiarchaeota archaeon]
MGKLNPNFEEPVFEGIMSDIEFLYNKIEKQPFHKHDDIIIKIINKYYKNRPDIENPFSNELLNYIRDSFIAEIWNTNRDSFKIKESTEKKIFTYLLDIFIEEFAKYERTEINEKNPI